MQRKDPDADAAWWFVELITAADVNRLWPRFEKWLHRHPRNKRAYEAIEHSWDRYDRPNSAMARRRGYVAEGARIH